ncbi:RNA polymerase II elongation factor ELL [Patella vulgata]|uniref:RNA polymerase II elongation factor ELL n=1 Tax=Patella vulgata TaxID=6465 RepID=UPI0021806270|nr:RNA polymerase II elongation factor ELL [Patella vulgata]
MAALVEGHDYGLISNETSIDQKTVIHVKLTDSALRAIEEFSKIKVGTNRRPSIQFNGKKGVLQFPSRSTSEDPRPVSSFQFFISEVPKDPNGSFDCIEQSNYKNKGKLERLPGSMQYRMGIRATEDVYKTTRERMTIAEEESKKNCAKEIKVSGRHISKKVKKVLPNTSSSISSNVVKPQPSKPSCAVRPMHKPSSNNSVSSSANHRLSGSNLANGSSSHSPNRPSGLNHSPPTGQGNGSSVSSSGKSVPVSNTNTTKVNPAIMALPYRDRIIHLLAVRPYKKPELYLRLQKDGIKEKDKNSLGTILKQVAIIGKDNSYSLAKHAYNDVRQDWSLYTDIDRQLLKRNLQNIQQGENRSASNSPAPSPASIVSNPESPSAPQKRQIEDTADNQPNKKIRISHTKKKKSDREELKPINGMNNVVKPEKTSPISLEKSHLDDNGNDVSSKREMPNYLGSYTLITNTDQRLKYKKDFNTQYEEYRQLHAQIESVVLKFGELRSQVKGSKEGTKDFEELKKRIVKEYEAKKTDPKYVEQKRRYEYLHKKLGHIKRLIIEYDSSQSVCS